MKGQFARPLPTHRTIVSKTLFERVTEELAEDLKVGADEVVAKLNKWGIFEVEE